MFLFLGTGAGRAGLPCAQCHKDIAARQARTAMATTWLGHDTAGAPVTGTVDFVVGGRRHGIGFLSYISEVEGIPLARKTLIQGRHSWSQDQQKMLLAPGVSSAEPRSLEERLGLVLSPAFEERCLSCHGQKQGGVTCESCHGSDKHPAKRLTNQESVAVCAQCHVGLTKFADPSGDDLLVANQVAAMQRSECFVQSGKAFTCTTCHDPHQDAKDDLQAVKACLNCHASEVKTHATGGCIGCHMPSVEMGPLHLVDHLIRVHPEQKAKVGPVRSQARPLSAYLRMIATNTEQEAARARERVRAGESFYAVAQEMSVDSSKAIGGYLGVKAGMALGYGEISEPVAQDGRWVICQRLPRDFRWEAEQLEKDAEATGSIKKAQEALKIYPHYLRALNFIGVSSGRPEVLRLAAKLYPADAGTKFALGSVLEAQGNAAAAGKAFEQAIALEKDFTAAYVRLGMIEYGAGDWQKAASTFREGLQIDPLSVDLNEGLGLALLKTGDAVGAKQATALAGHLR